MPKLTLILEPDKRVQNKPLNEQLLGIWLHQLFPNVEWIHNRWFNGYRPDYVSHELKMLVEFDGPQHYTNAGRYIGDCIRDDAFNSIGYTTIRIPYFIQLSTATINQLFGIDLKVEQQYNHGFIDFKSLLPASFCECGIYSMYNFIDNSCNEIKEQVFNSLKEKVKEKYPIAMIVPTNWLHSLLICNNYREFWNSILIPTNPIEYANTLNLEEIQNG